MKKKRGSIHLRELDQRFHDLANSPGTEAHFSTFVWSHYLPLADRFADQLTRKREVHFDMTTIACEVIEGHLTRWKKGDQAMRNIQSYSHYLYRSLERKIQEPFKVYFPRSIIKLGVHAQSAWWQSFIYEANLPRVKSFLENRPGITPLQIESILGEIQRKKKLIYSHRCRLSAGFSRLSLEELSDQGIEPPSSFYPDQECETKMAMEEIKQALATLEASDQRIISQYFDQKKSSQMSSNFHPGQSPAYTLARAKKKFKEAFLSRN